MTEPTIPWRDGLAEFLPPEKRTESIIRHILGEHVARPSRVDYLTDQIMQALTKETP